MNPEAIVFSTMMKKAHRRGKRGLLEADLVEGALAEIERGGLDGFSMRCAACALDCDAATLIYHFGSKEGLERAVTERLHSEIRKPDDTLPWDQQLKHLARQYRQAAQRYPEAFPLLLRFWTSGPRDLDVAELWHQALADAGIPEKHIAAVGCSTYASILGLCTGEVRGLLGLPSQDTLAELVTLDHLTLTKRLIPTFETLSAETIFETALELLIAGIVVTFPARKKLPTAKPVARRKS